MSNRYVLLAGLLAACGGSDPVQPDAAIDPPDAPPPTTRTITGTIVNRHVTMGGQEQAPADISQLAIAAYTLPDLTRIEGSGTVDGTFTIADVPEGTYYLQLGTTYLVTSQTSIDLSGDVLGRTNVAAVTQPSPLAFDVTNLQGWRAGDELQMFAPGSGTIAFAMQTTAAQPPAPGATSLAGFVFDLSRADYRADIDGAAGDRLVLTQLATQTVGNRTFRAIARSFEPAAFTIANGGSATLSGSFAVPATSTSLDVVWDRPAFDAALRPAVPGTAPDNYSVLGASALPEASTRGLYHSAPDLLVFEPGFGIDSTSVTAAWPYLDPYPTAWTRTLSARYFTYRFIQPPVGSPIAVFASMDVDVDRATLQAGATLSPLVGPVRDITIDGADAFGPVSGMGTTPTIAWQAPALGTASVYDVLVQRAGTQTETNSLVPVLLIQTSETSVRIPPGAIQSGSSYAFTVSARSAPGLDLDATPFRTSLPNGTAAITTELASP